MSPICSLFIFVFTYAQAVDVQTKYGPVRGQTHRLHNGVDVNSFLGVPFAKPPLGDLRFERPQEPDSWTEVFEAASLGDSCMQSVVGMIWMTHPLWTNISENCLNLNIYAPTDQSRGPYPVMVWLHGGGFQGSANIQYPGYYLASRDVVVVVPNYRLGIFGFLTTGDAAVPGNMGMWDMIQALRFVQENIAQFGGDPSQVTIFGESAGGNSVGLMIVSPQAQDLFHQAILQSGNELRDNAVAAPESYPGNSTKSLAQNLNCPTGDVQEMVACLRTIEAEELRTTRYNCTPGYSCSMRPVVDGPGGFMPDMPINLRKAGLYNRCTVLAGFNKEDGALFLLPLEAVVDMEKGINRTQYEEIVKDRLSGYALRFPERAEDVYEAIMYNYSPWPSIDDPIKNRDELIKLTTDGRYGASADFQLKMHVDENTAYMYVFAYKTKTINSTIVPEWLGTPHIMELPFVFGFPLNQLNPGVVDESLAVDFIDFDQDDIDFAEFTITLWTNFAKYGNPTPSPVQPPNNNTAISWQEYEHGNYIVLMIDRQTENRLNYRQKDFAFFNSYLAWMLGLDSITSFGGDSYDDDWDALTEYAQRIIGYSFHN